jgi:ABC-type microcin C transport system duplicated ATPase subunit YejF
MQMIFQDPFASLNPRWRVAFDIIAEPIRAFGLEGNARPTSRPRRRAAAAGRAEPGRRPQVSA